MVQYFLMVTCIRSLQALSIAASNHPEVVCFAQMNILRSTLDLDGVQTEIWAYIIDANGKGCYGSEDGTFYIVSTIVFKIGYCQMYNSLLMALFRVHFLNVDP